MSPRNRALLEFFFNTWALAITPLFARWLLPLNPFQIVSSRSIIAALFLVIFFAARKETLRVNDPTQQRTLIISGLLMAGHWLTLFRGLQIAPIGLVFLALYFYPIVIMLIEPWFFNEKYRWIDLPIGIVAFIGVYLLQPDFDLADQVTQGILWGLTSGVMLATRNVLSRGVAQNVGGLKQMAWQLLTISIVLLPIQFLMPYEFTPNRIGLLIILGIGFTALTHAVTLRTLRHLKAKTVGLISMSLVLYSSLLAWILFEEPLTWRMAIGGTLILGAAIYNALSEK